MFETMRKAFQNLTGTDGGATDQKEAEEWERVREYVQEHP
jgi:hypothetical protein